MIWKVNHTLGKKVNRILIRNERSTKNLCREMPHNSTCCSFAPKLVLFFLVSLQNYIRLTFSPNLCVIYFYFAVSIYFFPLSLSFHVWKSSNEIANEPKWLASNHFCIWRDFFAILSGLMNERINIFDLINGIDLLGNS